MMCFNNIFDNEFNNVYSKKEWIIVLTMILYWKLIEQNKYQIQLMR